MALSLVDRKMLGMLDHLTAIAAAAPLALAGGTSLRTRWAAADDDPRFMDRVLGADCDAADAAIAALNLGQIPEVKALLTEFNSYPKLDVGLSSFDGLLTARKLRLDGRLAQVLLGAGYPITATNLTGYADGGATMPGQLLGDFTRGGTVVSPTVIPTAYAPSPLAVRVAQIGSGDLSLTVTPVRAPVTTHTVALVVRGSGNSGAAGDAYYLGSEAIGVTGAAAGQKVIPLGVTGQFQAGETVLLRQFSGSAPDEVWTELEWGVIDSIVENVSLTLHANLLHTYTSAGFVIPCFRGVSAVSSTGGTAGDRVLLYPGSDRRVKA